MKLYVDESRTQWAGTQADAKKAFGKYDMWDVPTDKSGLLEFLNNYEVTDSLVETPQTASSLGPTPASLAPPPKTKPNDSLVGRCELVELKELSTTLRTLLFKTWNEMEKIEESES